MAPAYRPPPLPVAQAYPAPVEGGAAPIGSIGWRSFFSDPALRALIETALANNRDIRIAAARVAQARAGYAAQRGQGLPSLSAVGLGARAGVPQDLSLTGRAETLGIYSGSLNASWEADFWGHLRDQTEAARQTLLASEAARRAVATDLVRQTAELYLQGRELDERLALARQALANRQATLDLVRRRVAVGAAARLAQIQAGTQLDQAQADLSALELARSQTGDALTLLLGHAPPTPATAPGALAQADFGRDLPPGLPSALLVNRPDIVAAERQLRAAHADIGAARAAFFPDISLMATGGGISGELQTLFRAGSGTWAFAPMVSAPIFEGGRLRANLAASKAERDEALATYERSIQAAFRDVSDALAARARLGEEIESTSRTVAALGERARLAQLSFATGRTGALEALDAERDRITAEQGLVRLRRAYLASEVDLYAAVGGGFPEASRPIEQAEAK